MPARLSDEAARRSLGTKSSNALDGRRAEVFDRGPATIAAVETARYGKPTTVMPRLVQGSFRVLITDLYGRRCAVTPGEDASGPRRGTHPAVFSARRARTSERPPIAK